MPGAEQREIFSWRGHAHSQCPIAHSPNHSWMIAVKDPLVTQPEPWHEVEQGRLSFIVKQWAEPAEL
jgi:hypothetical protein